jgi:hypothetical protein
MVAPEVVVWLGLCQQGLMAGNDAVQMLARQHAQAEQTVFIAFFLLQHAGQRTQQALALRVGIGDFRFQHAQHDGLPRSAAVVQSRSRCAWRPAVPARLVRRRAACR